MGLRERKKLATKAAIAEAASRLFLLQGFEKTTIDDIVAEVAISRRTFFRYYPSKESVFFHEREARLRSFIQGLAGETERRTARRAVYEALIATATLLQADPQRELDRHATLAQSKILFAQHARLDQAWERAIAVALRANATSDPEGELHAAMEAGAIIGVLHAARTAWVEQAGAFDLPTIARRAFACLDHGFASEDR